MAKRVKGTITDWSFVSGLITAHPNQGDDVGPPNGQTLFCTNHWNMQPDPLQHPVQIGEEVAFLWSVDRDYALAHDVVRLRYEPPRVFLAHSSADKPFVRRLAKRLESSGIKVWLDEWEILVGESIVERISEGLREAYFLCVVLSTESVGSPWVTRELSSSLMRELNERSIFILPVLKEHCDIPPLLADRLYADCSDNIDTGVAKLVNSIKTWRDDLFNSDRLTLSSTGRPKSGRR